jgi:predicted secreted protein
MGIVREPEGVDFIVKSRKLTKKELQLITDYIDAFKEKQRKKAVKSVSSRKSQNTRTKVKTIKPKK